MVAESYIKLDVISSDKYKMDKGQIFLSIDKTLSFGKYNIAYKFPGSFGDGQWVLKLSEDTDLTGYVAFLLNDPLYLKQIIEEDIKQGKKYKITKSKIAKILVPKIDRSISVYYSCIELIFQSLYWAKDKSDTEELMLDVFNTLRLALSFELHNFQIAQELNLRIFENWKYTVDSIGTDMLMIFNELMKSDNILWNNVRRFQLLIGALNSLNHQNNGLEIK